MRALRSMASALLVSTTTLLSWTYAPHANAATTYLVQLGSYDSEKQALDQWNKVNKRFPNLFGSLRYIPKTVKMPPDNVTYHRTQAGPLKSRGDAEAVCDDMQVSGYECYVVETAVIQNAPASAAVKPVSMPETATSKPQKVEKAEKTEQAAPKTAAAMDKHNEEVKIPVTKPVVESASAKPAALPQVAAAAIPVPAHVPTPKPTIPHVVQAATAPTIVTKQEDSTQPKVIKVEAEKTPHTETEKTTPAPTALPKAVKAAEDPEIEAMFAQATTNEEVAPTTKKEEKKSDEAIKPITTNITSEKAKNETLPPLPSIAKPLEQPKFKIEDDVSSIPTETVSLLNSLSKKADAETSNAKNTTYEKPAAAVEVPASENKQEAKTLASPAPKIIATTSAKPKSIAPTPATPISSPFKAAQSDSKATQDNIKKITDAHAPLPWLTQTQSAPHILPTPVTTEVKRTETTPSSLLRTEPDAMPRVENPTDAKVEVEEAIRVPLSTAAQPEIRADFNATPDAERYGYPSQTLSTANLWAEISYFPNQNAALSYWQTLRERATDLPVGLRIRVTKPFMKYRTTEQMSLRVGPFNSNDAIRSLCKATETEQLHCKSIKEFGDSSAAKTPSSSRYGSTGRYYQRKHQLESGWKPLGLSSQSTYYIQLGSFSSPVAAQNEWETMKASHEATFAGVSEQIINPRFSSATSGRYRLRAGPFGSSVSAVNACEQLRRDGIACAVVSGN